MALLPSTSHGCAIAAAAQAATHCNHLMANMEKEGWGFQAFHLDIYHSAPAAMWTKSLKEPPGLSSNNCLGSGHFKTFYQLQISSLKYRKCIGQKPSGSQFRISFKISSEETFWWHKNIRCVGTNGQKPSVRISNQNMCGGFYVLKYLSSKD